MAREEYIIRMLGANRLFQGYSALISCIRLAAEDENRLLSLENDLYPCAAAETGCSVSAMKHNMDTLIRHCWEKGPPESWGKLAGCPIRHCPSLGEFIELATWYLRDHPQP